MSAIYYCDVCSNKIETESTPVWITWRSSFKHICKVCLESVEEFLEQRKESLKNQSPIRPQAVD